MNRQKIEQRIEELEIDLDGYKALPIGVREIFEGKGESKREEITFLQSLLDEPEDITETIQSFLKNATDEELQKVLKDSDPDGVFAQIKDKVFSDQQPLDAPTHSGWWWNENYHNPIYFTPEDEDLLFDLEAELGSPLGKWLPANNPFGKGEL